MLTAGTRLGPYEILSTAGAGGMGEVYRARDNRLDRTVALKLLPPHLAAREDLRQRFHIEARAIAKLQHSNICSVFDVGQESGVNYMILEYLEGETLEKRLQRGALPVSEVLQLGARIAAGLDAAHRAGITHRDLKPANIMLTKSGPKLLDFGLAKLDQKAVAASAGVADAATLTKPLTEEGTIMGTFQYMAPEQLEGAGADARTDIFAFGVALYEMIAGRKAFYGRSRATLISAIMSADPTPLSTFKPETPPALERVIQRCLAKDPDERWQTARDLARELEWIALGGSQPGATAPAAMRRVFRWSWVIAAAALLSTAAIAWVHFTESPEPLPTARFTVPLPTNSTFIAGPLIAPDGSKALVWLGTSGDWRIYVYTLATREYRPLPGSEFAQFTAWSPDSRSIATLSARRGELRRIDVTGGAAAVLAKTRSPTGVAWSRHGVILFNNGEGALHRVSSNGGASEKVLSLAPNEAPIGLQFLPDGEQFLFSAGSSNLIETRVASLRGGPAKAILQTDAPAIYSNAGQLLFTRNGALLAQAFDARSLALSGAPSTIAPSVTTGLRLFSTSQNGILMFHAGRSQAQRMSWFDRTGKPHGDVGKADEFSNPAISPDGKRLAVAIGVPNGGRRDIWVYDLTRGGSYRLTFDPADDFSPVWSPDGRYIAFGSNRKGQRDLYRKLASGTGEDELLFTSQKENKTFDSWSRDGVLWVTVSTSGQAADIYRFSLPDRKFEKYLSTPSQEDRPHLSPDGRWLAYHTRESGRDEIYIQPYPATGDRWQVSTAGGTEPQWRADSRELFFLTGNAITAVDIKPAGKSLEIGAPHALFEAKLVDSNIRNRFVASSDGQRFLVIVHEEQDTNGFETIINWPALLKAR